MAASNFYSGDLTPLNDAHVAAQDADTRTSESLRNYLYHLALVKAERDRTATHERIAGRDADVRQNLGTGQINLGYRGLDVDERKALARMALDRELGLGDIAQRGRAVDVGAATAASDIASRERLGNRGLGVQERLGVGDQATRRYGYGVNLKLGEGDQAVRRDLGTADLALRRDLGFGQLDADQYRVDTGYDMAADRNRSEIKLRELINSGAVEAIATQGRFAQPNYHLVDSVFQNNAVTDEANAQATGAAARANMLIPSAINKLGVNNYNGLRFLPGFHSRADYQRAMADPNGDPGMRSEVWNEVLSRVAPADQPYILPGPNGISPVMRPRMAMPSFGNQGAVPATSGTSVNAAMERDRLDALDAARRAASFPDARVRIANIQQAFASRWGYPLQ
jgi:hypothetical protein